MERRPSYEQAKRLVFTPKTLTPEFEAFLDQSKKEEVGLEFPSIATRWVEFVIEQVKSRFSMPR